MGFFSKVDPYLQKNKEEIKMKLNCSGYSYSRSGIKKFQKDHNLKPTGTVDLLTYTELIFPDKESEGKE